MSEVPSKELDKINNKSLCTTFYHLFKLYQEKESAGEFFEIQARL